MTRYESLGRKLNSVAIVLTTLLLTGCAVIKTAVQERQLTKLSTAEEANVIDRVEQRWDALIGFDIPKVYEFATPSYRTTFNADHLYSSYANNIRRTRAEVQRIVFDQLDPPVARVTTHLYFEYSLDGQPAFESFNPVNEAWIKYGDEWWFIEPR